MFGDDLQQQYKGYTICGSAEPVHNDSGLYFAHASVLLTLPNMNGRFLLLYYCYELIREFVFRAFIDLNKVRKLFVGTDVIAGSQQ